MLTIDIIYYYNGTLKIILVSYMIRKEYNKYNMHSIFQIAVQTRNVLSFENNAMIRISIAQKLVHSTIIILRLHDKNKVSKYFN